MAVRRAARVATRTSAVALLLLAGGLSCGDAPTAPSGDLTRRAAPGPQAAATPQREPDYSSLASPDSWNYDGGPPSGWDGSTPQQNMGYFHFPTVIRVSISGTIYQVPGILPGYNLSWGPTGTADHQAALAMKIVHPWGAGMYFPTAAPQTVVIQHQAYGLRTGLNDPQPWGEYYWSCGRLAGNIPCWGFEGDSRISYTRYKVGLTLTSNESGRAKVGQTVTFTAGREQDYIEGRPVDMSLIRWTWQPEGENAAADTITCNTGGGATCGHTMRGSGTMTVKAFVNGAELTQSRRVSVNQARVTLSASETEVFSGDTVTLSATAPGAEEFVVQGYDFEREGGVIMAVTDPAGKLAGTRRLASTTMSSAEGAPPCSPGTSAETCIVMPEESGTWTVRAMVDGEAQTAKVQVKVKPTQLDWKCTPSSVQRGGSASCTLRSLNPKRGFYIVGITSTLSAGGAPIDLTPTRRDYVAGETFTTAGTMVTTTDVVAAARPLGGQDTTITQSITVTDRGWTLPRPGPAGYESNRNAVKWGSNYTRTLVGDKGRAGLSMGDGFEASDVATQRVDAGPNHNLVFILTEPTLPPWEVWLNPSLFPPSPWINLQNGAPGQNGAKPTCTASDVPKLIVEVKRHEGIGRAPNSHLGVEDRFRPAAALDLDRMYTRDDPPATGTLRLRKAAARRWTAMVKASDPAHTQFDNGDTQLWQPPGVQCDYAG